MARVPVGVLEPVLTTVRSRRAALRGVLAAVGALTVSRPAERTEAKKKKEAEEVQKADDPVRQEVRRHRHEQDQLRSLRGPVSG